jgi:hypothetical protein
MSSIHRILSQARAVRTLAGPVPSPCSSVCTMHPAQGVCQGCWRTLQEITLWAGLDEDDKRQVWRNIEARASAEKT